VSHCSNSFDVFANIVSSRHCVRSFRPDPVPRDVLDRVLRVAQQAPSNCNTQPWLTYVVGGARCERLAQALLSAAMENRMSKDYPFDGKYAGVYQERQFTAAACLADAQGIAREDKVRRQQAVMRNFGFFGAPHAIILCMHDWCGVREAGDVGIYAQTLMLGLTAAGIGSCPQTAIGMFSDVVREHLELPDDQKVFIGISFGYADDNPVNNARPPRAGLNESAHYLD
jgi:nitroreductase